MTDREKLIYQNASLEKEVADLRGRYQNLKSWLKVTNEGIWQDYTKFRESQGLKINSNGL